jgi:hypothetical protein
MSVSSKVYVRKAVTDIDPRTGRPLYVEDTGLRS